jgi:hypothetical protein
MSRVDAFKSGASDDEFGKNWLPRETREAIGHARAKRYDDPSFELKPEQEAYYDVAGKVDEINDRIAAMPPEQRKQAQKALAEGVRGGKPGAPGTTQPKRGDPENPYKKDMPPPPKPPRQPRQQNPMVRAKSIQRLGKIARGTKGRRR